MTLYSIEVPNKRASLIPEVDFGSQKLYERYDIQEWVEKEPKMLGEPLLIVAKEFSAFDKTSERADLIALDKPGNIVIIELKKDNSGADVHWQAIKYASYFSRIGFESIAKVYAKYHKIEFSKAQEEILSFVEIDDHEEINSCQRIILASHRFAPEVTSAVLWLNQNGLKVSCVQMVPYLFNEQLVVQVQRIIPVVESGFFEVTVMVGDEEVPISREDNRIASDQISQALRRIYERTQEALVPTNLNPTKCSRWAGTYNSLRYFKFWFNSRKWANHRCSFQLHVHTSNPETTYLSAKYVIDMPWASAVGINEDQLNQLIQALQNLSADASFVANESFIALEKFFPRTELYDDRNIVSFLKTLVEAVHPIIGE